MSDNSSDQGGSRPARPVVPPFRGPGAAPRPAGGPPRPAGPGRQTVPPFAPPVSGRPGTPARPATPIRSTPARPASPARLTPPRPRTPVVPVTPVAATPVAPPEAVTPVVNPALDAEPMPWEGGTPTAAPAADITPLADDARDAPAVAAADVDGWLTPDTAVRGEFGELVEPPPAQPEPAWDPMADQPLGAGPAEDAWFAEPGVPAEPGLSDEPTALAEEARIDDPWATTAQDVAATDRRETPVVPMPAADASDADWDYTGKAGSYGADAVADAVEASAGHLHDEQAAGAPTAPTGTDGWVDGYDETAAALFGEPEESPDAAQAAAPETYLAAEWPPAAADAALPHADPSTLATPVIGSVVVPPVPSADVPPDASLAAAIEEPAAQAHIGLLAGDAMEGREGVAMALERIAARVRSGELPVTGATAVSDAAALAATLAALLGVSARE